MTNDEILQAAKEAGLFTRGNGYYAVCHQTEIERFAAIIEKRTIERCAVVAAIGPTEENWTDDSDYDVGMMMGHRNAAEAIRKLGEQ
jgi:hypothetical protein